MAPNRRVLVAPAWPEEAEGGWPTGGSATEKLRSDEAVIEIIVALPHLFFGELVVMRCRLIRALRELPSMTLDDPAGDSARGGLCWYWHCRG